jgi:hypothetical protein
VNTLTLSALAITVSNSSIRTCQGSRSNTAWRTW